MNFIYIFCLATLLYGSSYGELINQNLDMVKQFVNERSEFIKLKSIVLEVCPGYGNKFELAYTKMSTCMHSINTNEETICSYLRNHLERCTSPLSTMMEECLPDKSKDTPTFVIKSIMSTVNYICKTDGEHLIELQNPCIYMDRPKLHRCLLKTRSRLQQYATMVPSKTEVCDFLKSMRFCLKSHLEASCGNFVTRESMMGVFDSALSPCELTSEPTIVNEVETY